MVPGWRRRQRLPAWRTWSGAASAPDVEAEVGGRASPATAAEARRRANRGEDPSTTGAAMVNRAARRGSDPSAARGWRPAPRPEADMSIATPAAAARRPRCRQQQGERRHPPPLRATAITTSTVPMPPRRREPGRARGPARHCRRGGKDRRGRHHDADRRAQGCACRGSDDVQVGHRLRRIAWTPSPRTQLAPTTIARGRGAGGGRSRSSQGSR